MRLYEITRRNFLGAIGASAATALIAKVHAQPSMISKNYNVYDTKIQQSVVEIVAKLKNIKFNPSVPLPKVVSWSDIDPNIFNETWKWVPTIPAPHYHWIRNTIILTSTSKIDTLAHEYVHYFQFHPQYENQSEYVLLDRDGIFEYEARKIQKLFIKQLEQS